MVKTRSENDSGLFASFHGATGDDLAALRAREGALVDELAGLRVLIRALALRLGVSPKANGNGKAPAAPKRRMGPVGVAERTEVVKHLAEFGPRPAEDVADDLGISMARLLKVLDHEWFTSSAQGTHITPAARQAVL